MQQIKLKRAYDPQEASDGFRVYVDRLWPRGLSHVTFHYDLWDKGIAPDDDLRHWFHEDPDNRWTEFRDRYMAELRTNPSVNQLKELLASHPVVTLLYSSHDAAHNNAVVLRDFLVG